MERSTKPVPSRGVGTWSSYTPEALARPATKYTPLFLATLCLSVSMLGGCAAAGVAAAIRESARQSDLAATATASVDAGALLPNQTISIPSSSSITYSGSDLYSTANFTDNGRVTSFSSPTNRSVSVSITTGLLGNVSTITYTTPDGTTSFSGNQIRVDGPAIIGQSDTTVFTAIQQDYSSFGIWSQSLSSNSAAVGVTFSGNTTPQMPTTGTATYSGAFAGFHTSSSGSVNGSFGMMSSAVNFGSRTGTIAAPSVYFDDGTVSSALGFSGNFTVTGAALSGTLTDNRGTSGTIQGAFFGPSAIEMGGTFFIRGAGLENHIGSFGLSK